MSQKNDAGPCRGCLAEMQAAKPEEFKKLLNRLNRAEGQLKGVKRMLEEGAQCPEVLVQVSAVTSALNSFTKELLSIHLTSCVADNLSEGNREKLKDFMAVFQKLLH